MNPNYQHSAKRSGDPGRLLTVLLLLLTWTASAQRPDFVDGYHGGAYGHYPLEWKTRFIVSTLESHPDWCISLEIEPETWDSAAVRTPADYARFKAIAASPRIEFTNPTYAQPYCYNISGESIIRQFIYGIRKLRAHFPDAELTTYAVEEPCFTSCLPQILNLLGYRYASLKCPNTCWGGYTAPYGGETVNWISPDGSSILASPRYACEELLEGSVWQTTAWGNQPEYLDACRKAGILHPVGMCFQDAGWRNGPWIGYGDKTRADSRYVTWRAYFEGLGSVRAKDDYRFSQEDVRPALMWGSQVLQRIAQQVRRSENLLPAAEKMATLARLTTGYDYPQEEMDEAWRTLMLAQHHDSWIVPYNRLHGQGTWAEHIARWTASADARSLRVIRDAQDGMGGTREIEGSEAFLRVYNTQGFARREVVAVSLPASWQGRAVAITDAVGHSVEATCTGDEMRLTAEVPAFGYATYRVERQDSAAAEPADPSDEESYTIENEAYRISVDPQRGGVIRELKVKGPKGGFEYVDTDSEYGFGELRGHFYDRGGFRSSTETPARVTKGRSGEMEEWLLIEGRIATHPFTQRITLRRDAPEIDIELTIDWRHNEGIGEFRQPNAYAENHRACYDDRFKLSLLFPAALDNPRLDKDAPFDVCRSQLTDTHFKTWDSIKHNIILNWVDLSEPRRGGRGLALLTDHTTTYRHGRNEPLGLTVQYAGSGLWGRNYPIDSATHIRCALVPHKGAWDKARIDRINACRNEPLLCALHDRAGMKNRSLIDTGDSGYEVVAAYPTDGGIVVRLFNASGSGRTEKIRFGKRFARIDEIDLNDRVTASCRIAREKEGCSVALAMPRFGLKTLLIHDKR